MRPRLPSWMRSRDDEPQVGLDELVLAAFVAPGDPLGQPYLVGVGEEAHTPDLREVHPDGVAGGDGVGDLDRRRLVDLNGGRRRLGRSLRHLPLHEGYLLFLQRGVELLDLGRREVPFLYEVSDLLRTEKTLTSPAIQELVSALSQHHGVLGRHLSPLLTVTLLTLLVAAQNAFCEISVKLTRVG